MKSEEVIDEKMLIWKEFKSQKGVPYSVGYLEDEVEQIDQMIFDASTAESQNTVQEIDVDWKVLNDAWKIPTNAVQDEAHISKYHLNIDGDGKGIWSYYLGIHNTKRNITYHFTDQSGDTYKLWCFWERNHYLKYNSPEPTIVRISW